MPHDLNFKRLLHTPYWIMILCHHNILATAVWSRKGHLKRSSNKANHIPESWPSSLTRVERPEIKEWEIFPRSLEAELRWQVICVLWGLSTWGHKSDIAKLGRWTLVEISLRCKDLSGMLGPEKIGSSRLSRNGRINEIKCSQELVSCNLCVFEKHSRAVVLKVRSRDSGWGVAKIFSGDLESQSYFHNNVNVSFALFTLKFLWACSGVFLRLPDTWHRISQPTECKSKYKSPVGFHQARY